MSLPRKNRSRASTRSRALRSATRRRRSRRGVSDVVATILILALTVTLFASIFAFVGAFPAPPPQNVSEFQAALVRTTNGTYFSGLTIEHLAGPALPGSDHIYLEPSTHVSDWQFSINGGVPVSWGLPGNSSTTTWNLGQSWTTTFAKLVRAPNNITVYITTPSQLLFSVDLPGPAVNVPPAILSDGITSGGVAVTSVGIGQAFQIWASLSGNLTGLTDTVNLASIPGLSGNSSLHLYNGLYVSNVTGGLTTTSGSYFAFLYVSNGAGQLASDSIPVNITTTVVTPPSQLSVTVGVAPQPFSISGSTPGSSLYPWSTVTYSGTKANVAVYVNFSIVEFQGGKAATTTGHVTHTTITGPSGVTVSGPASVTIFSQTAFTTLLNTTTVVYANLSLPGVGTATGSTSFGPYNLVLGYTYFTSSSSGATSGNVTMASHSCSSSSCPYLWLTVKDSFTTAAYFGPASLTFNGYVNVTCLKSTGPSCGTAAQSYTISSTVSSGGSTVLNVITDSTTGTTRWTPPAGGGTLNYDYTATLTLTITSGSTVVGYIWDAALLNFTT